jgi:hypothetical protein
VHQLKKIVGAFSCMAIVKINHNTFWFVSMSISISKRTAVAFAYAFAYAWPYCTKNFIFCTNNHEHKQQSATLNCRKIWAIAQKIVNKFFRIFFACAQLFFFL